MCERESNALFLSAPTEEARVPVPGGEIYLRRTGGGAREHATLIIVHGGPGLSHEPLEPLEALGRPELAVVSYDQRGVGQSSGVPDHLDYLGEAVRDLDAVRVAVGADRARLVGHARGGLLAALYAARHPERVSALALIDSFPPTADELDAACDRQAARLRDFQRRGLVPGDLPSLEDDGYGRLLAVLPVLFADPTHPSARTLGGARFSLAAFRASLPALRSYDVGAELARVRAPSLHLIAAVPFGSQMAAATAAAIGGPSRRLVLRDAGHLAWLERPERVLAALTLFLSEIDQTNQQGA
jgi:pimeloyl-ACP methyl ester carboxylesterase